VPEIVLVLFVVVLVPETALFVPLFGGVKSTAFIIMRRHRERG
jgi:hypothetical protein